MKAAIARRDKLIDLMDQLIAQYCIKPYFMWTTDDKIFRLKQKITKLKKEIANEK